MATIYISYRRLDTEIVHSLVPLLKDKGHKIRFDQELYIGSGWQRQLLEALLSSDVVLLLWSQNTIASHFVCAEVGAARASSKVGLMPVVIGDTEIPYFIQDLEVERIPDSKIETLKKLSKKIDVSIQKYIDYRNLYKQGKPKIFISHRHKDENIVRALADCIKTYFKIDKQDIRCTSVRPYRLPVGENTSDRLRDEISDAEVVLGILTTDTLASSYVAFELGSAWGQRVWTCPLLARGADQSHIPDPIRGLSALLLSNSGDCFQFLNDLEGFTSLIKRKDLDHGELSDKIQKLVEAAKET